MMFLGLRKLGNICCGHKMFLHKIRNIFLCPGHKICVRNKCCARGQTGKHLCRQQCVRNNVSSFARALSVDSGLHFFGFAVLEQCSTEYRKVLCFVLLLHKVGLKKHLRYCHSNRIKTKTTRDSLARIFKRFNQLHVFTSSFDCFSGFCVSFVIWRVITLVLVLRHSIKIQNQSNPSNQSQRTDNPVSRSKSEARAYNRHKTRISLVVTSHWLRKWRQLFQFSSNQGNEKPKQTQLTVNNQVKTAMLLVTSQ